VDETHFEWTAGSLSPIGACDGLRWQPSLLEHQTSRFQTKVLNRLSWGHAVGRPPLDALNSFQAALAWTETQQRIEALLKRGLQQDGDFERRWPEVLDTLVEPGRNT